MKSDALPPGDTIFLSLCALLGTVPGPAATAIERLGDRDDTWITLAGLANDQRVAAYLHGTLTRMRLETPAGFSDYVRVVAEANARRNLAIGAQLLEVAQHLNSVGIIPMAVKGAAFLTEATDTVSGRMPLDLDLMVEEWQFKTATDALNAAGYRFSQREDKRAHARNLFHPERPVSIDVHRSFGRQRSLLPASDVWDAAELSALAGARMLAPSTPHRLFHSIFHAELQNRFHSLGHISLQLMLDIVDLLTRHGSIDVEAAARPFESRGLGHIFASAIYAAHATIGAPAGPAGASARAHRHYRRCLFQLRHRLAHQLIGAAWMLGHPFSRYRLGYRCDCEDDDLRLNLMRLALPIRLLREHRANLPAKVALSWGDLSVKLR